ncbi:MAG: BlaI/MecI/CopY family transcriptional regulator [Omnitrophica WOR_2 bacterium]
MRKKSPKQQISQLGELEADVMNVVWEKGKVTVQDVKDTLEPRRSLAYTTIMTVMSRLAEKGMLDRQKEGRAFYYTPAASQEKVAGSLLQSIVRRLYDGATGKAIAQLLETEENVDDEELERLEELIRSRRARKK